MDKCTARTRFGRLRRATWLGALTALSALLGGCADPTEDVPPAKVTSVTHYGLTLDESASPQQVAYVLLRSLAEDVRAAQAHKTEEQKQAALVTWSLAAPSEIERRILDTLRKTAKDPTKYKSLGAKRDQEIHRIVNLWASIVAFYVGSFDTDAASAIGRMNVSQPRENEAVVLYEAWPDPPTPQEEFNRHHLIRVELVKEPGDAEKQYWRVARVSFQPIIPRPATRPARTATTQPTTMP